MNYGWKYSKVMDNEIILEKEASNEKISLPKIYNREFLPKADTEFPEYMICNNLKLLKLNNLALYPKHVIISRDSFGILPISFKKHRHHKHAGVKYLGNEIYIPSNNEYNNVLLTQVDFPIYYADTEYPDIYGHNLLEVLVQAWAWKECYELNNNIKFLTSSKPKEYLLKMLSTLGINEKDIYIIDKPISVKECYYPEPPIKLRRYIHPISYKIIDTVKNNLIITEMETYEKIYISRSKIKERRLINEDEIEKIFESFGFQIIHPQLLEISQQITLFANAKCIAGTGGSAMHNMIFGVDNLNVLILCSESWFTVIDTLISTKSPKFNLGYVFGLTMEENNKRSKEDWTINENDVIHAIKNHFDL